MFYLLYGQDTYRSREKLKDLLESFRAKVSGAAFFTVDENNFNEADFEELLKAKSLFDKKYVITADNLFGNKNCRDFVFGKIKQCAQSENIFLFLEEEIEEKHLKELKKHAVKVQSFDRLSGVKLKTWFNGKKVSPIISSKIIGKCGSDLWCASREIEKHELGSQLEESKKPAGHNPFAICDAFAEKNKAKTWVLYQRALMDGIPAEEIFSKILWQVKNLLLVKKLMLAGVPNVAKETGLHYFVAGKAMKAAKNFSEEDLAGYSYEMLKIYHKERRGESELPIEFEKFILFY